VVGALWVFGFLCMGNPEISYSHIGVMLIPVLGMSHIIEMVAFVPELKKMGKPLVPNLFLVFIFGLFHMLSLRAEME